MSRHPDRRPIDVGARSNHTRVMIVVVLVVLVGTLAVATGRALLTGSPASDSIPHYVRKEHP